ARNQKPAPGISSDSFLIHSGPPAVYQLRPKKGKIESLTKITVGKKNINKINKTILLVGETGGGKSTLINTLVNYTMGVKWEDQVWFQIVEEEKKSQTESQTSDVFVYEIFGFEGKTLPYSLTIIDTPGYGDTRGLGHDDTIGERLLDLFRSDDGVHELHAVGLVMKATDNRLSDRQKYIFNSMISLFGKNLEKNILALMTHSDGMPPKNPLKALEDAKIKCAKNEKNEPVHFLFDNQQSKERKKEYEDALKYSWDLTEKQMGYFVTFLESCGPEKLMKTKKVLKKRLKLKASIQNLQERINLNELKQTEIKQLQVALKKHEESMKKNENFIVEFDEGYKEKEIIKGGMWGLFYEGALCCTVCEENCHYPGCTTAWYPGHCQVMKDGCCTVCTKKCPASKHVKEKWKYVTKTRRVTKTLEDMKAKYERNKDEGQNKSSLLENLEKEMIQLTAERSKYLDESYQHAVKLEEIALKVNPVSSLVHFDFLIEKMTEKGDTEKVQKLEEMRSRVDEETRAVVEQVQRKLTIIGQSS
uniref:AIG1-type G domain-containing protein n=1 Tax=Amphilophus citrinellus TaxID=61819 RepID=A0A3Q0QZ34_AMPCI